MTRSSISLLALLSAAACVTAPEILPFEITPVPASMETEPMVGTGDRADDPAVWVNAQQPGKSLILGTNKDEGLHVYDLTGKELQFLDVGQVNNIDVRGPLAVASNDEFGGLSWFEVSGGDAPSVRHLGDTPLAKIEPYGVCLGIIDGQPVAGITYKDGTVQLAPALLKEDQTIQTPDVIDRYKFASQLEGCVFDEAAGTLFIGEETHGIWALDLTDAEAAPVSIDTIAAGNGLVEDVEGISLWKGEDGDGYLIASAQEADRFVVYDREAPYTPRGIFSITQSDDGTIDAVSHTDGIDVVSAALPGYPRGVLIVQDDANPTKSKDQNFKLVDWAAIEAALGLGD